ncbi:MAG: hypothetical protein G01um101413_287 [Parcubacteria group bacterium Gr01-1014_13]|nr:MAG: hypothetical protein G01um101413_287 [Parcubacteria group bacterium Gr01-1014_13]
MSQISPWVRVIDEAMRQISIDVASIKVIAKLGKKTVWLSSHRCKNEDFSWYTETYAHTIHLHTTTGWWFWKKEFLGKLLCITDVAQPIPMEEFEGTISYARRNIRMNDQIVPYKGERPLKCELFLDDPQLRQIAHTVLEPLAKQLGYKRIEYINMSHDPSAYYPGERSELPKAMLLDH